MRVTFPTKKELTRIIEFDNARSASRAKKILNGTKINGREIYAQFVIPFSCFMELGRRQEDAG